MLDVIDHVVEIGSIKEEVVDGVGLKSIAVVLHDLQYVLYPFSPSYCNDFCINFMVANC